MGKLIHELITFCEEKEYNHRVSCKRYDDASGYTRSKDKNIRTTEAIREEEYGDIYKQIADIMRKHQNIEWIAERYEAHTKEIPDKGPRAMMNDILKIVKGEKK